MQAVKDHATSSTLRLFVPMRQEAESDISLGVDHSLFPVLSGLDMSPQPLQLKLLMLPPQT